MKFFFKQILKVSAFCLEKQKSFIPKKFLSCCQYQNKKDLYTDSIFSEGFAWEFVCFWIQFPPFDINFASTYLPTLLYYLALWVFQKWKGNIFCDFSCMFIKPNNFLNSNYSDMRNLQEQVKKAFCYQKFFWLSLLEYCSNNLKHFANSWPSVPNFKKFSWSLEQFW